MKTYGLMIFLILFTLPTYACDKGLEFSVFLDNFRNDRSYQIANTKFPIENVEYVGEFDGPNKKVVKHLSLNEMNQKGWDLFPDPDIMKSEGYTEDIHSIDYMDGEVNRVSIGPPYSSSMIYFYFKKENNCWSLFMIEDLFSIHGS